MKSSRRYAKIACLAFLAAFLLAGRSEGAAWEQSAWRSRIYYRTTFEAAVATGALLHIAAVDSYRVYLNGALVGADSAWTRMASYAVAVKSGKNEVGVEVTNRGRGGGSGLLLAVAADDTLAEGFLAQATTNRSIQTWYWTAAGQTGTAWTTANVEKDDAWKTVQEGAVDRNRIESLIDTSLATIAGLPGSIDLGRVEGSLTLSQIRGENLALDKPSNRIAVVDGDLNTAWEPPTNSLNFFASIDLQVRRHVHTVRVISKGKKEADFQANSLRGYSVQVSDDQIRWSEVGVLHDITQYAWTEVRFIPVWTRYVRVVIVDIDPTTSPKVAEVEVFGEGYKDEGIFLSEPLDLGAAAAKNFGRVAWDAVIPERTELSLQFRTGNAPADFTDAESGWSRAVTERDVWFPSPEPGRYLQYRVHLVSRDDRRTPEFRSIRFDYSGDIAVSQARGRISPNKVPMGVDTTFTCVLDMDFRAGDLGIEKLRIDVPAQAWLDEGAAINDLLASWQSSQHALTLVFAAPLKGTARLEIPFRTKSYSSVHAFRAYLFSPGSENPLNAGENQDEDVQAGRPYSWATTVTTSRDDALSGVRANPSVFTPNGDRINDYTVIEFILSKVGIPKTVAVRIFDLSGRVVRDLDVEPLTAGAYTRPGDAEQGIASPGYWDGRDQAGELVPPGIYFYQVEIDLDTGDEVQGGLVSVVY